MAVRWRVVGGDGARVVGRGGERRRWRWGGESEGAVMRREFGTSERKGSDLTKIRLTLWLWVSLLYKRECSA